MTTNDLRERTQKEIQSGRREWEEAQARDSDIGKAAREAADLARYRDIINYVPVRAGVAAKAGKSYAIVMDLSSGDYEEHVGHTDAGVCVPDWLLGAALHVFADCKEAGLDPKVHNGLEEDYEHGAFFIAIPV